METIVVGVDGSDCGRAALEFAADEAALRGAQLRIVSIWHVPTTAYGGGFALVVDGSAFESFRERTQGIVDEAVAAVKQAQPAVECEGKAVEGQPAATLLEEGADASLIVVGNRGLGGFASLLVGSVSQQVVHHASCPVVVVREKHEQNR